MGSSVLAWLVYVVSIAFLLLTARELQVRMRSTGGQTTRSVRSAKLLYVIVVCFSLLSFYLYGMFSAIVMIGWVPVGALHYAIWCCGMVLYLAELGTLAGFLKLRIGNKYLTLVTMALAVLVISVLIGELFSVLRKPTV